MKNVISIEWSRRIRKISILLLALLGLALAFFYVGREQVDAGPVCQPVHGQFSLIPVTQNCTSPVGICARGSFDGGIQGTYTSELTAFIPSADTASTGLILFTADTNAELQVGSSVGNVLLKEGGAFNLAGPGDFSETFVIVNGSGSFSNATGLIHAFGAFDAVNGGQATYDGSICLP